MDTKKIAEQVIESLRGDIEREVEKRLAAQKPKFLAGEWIARKDGNGFPMVYRQANKDGTFQADFDNAVVSGGWYQEYRLATHEEIRDALRLKRDDLVRHQFSGKEGSVIAVVPEGPRDMAVEIQNKDGISYWYINNVHLVRRTKPVFPIV